MAQETNVWPALVIVAAILLIANSLVTFYAVPNEFTANVDFTGVNARLDSLNANVLALQKADAETSIAVVPTIVLTKSEQEEELTEAKALELATEYINSRDFKKLVFDALVDEGETIENYKDITELKVLDSDVDYNEEDTTVTYSLKAYYFIDGDDEEVEKAKLNDVIIEFDELEYDDEFEDAEVVELTSVAVEKIYE